MQIKDLVPVIRRGGALESREDEQNPLAVLQREMNQMFESIWKRIDSLGLPSSNTDAKSDVVETENAVEVSIELPGMEVSDIEVSIVDNMLTVKGEKKVERKEEKRGYYLSERSYGAVHRVLPLPPGTDSESAEASFKNGVLTVRLPQAPGAQTAAKRIEIKPE